MFFMRFTIDHDYHIHTTVSGCCHDSQQTPENILNFAENKGFKKIVVTNHLWDESSIGDERRCWRQYESASLKSLKTDLPLPKSDKVEFVFGCEGDMDENYNIGIHPDNYDLFGFIVIATTHFHFWYGNEVTVPERTKLYIKRFEKLLESDLPFGRVGLAHLGCRFLANISPTSYLDVLDSIPDSEFYELFKGAKEKGLGIEINVKAPDEEGFKRIMRPHFIAKDCGCKFYIGSDSHSLAAFEPAYAMAQKTIDALGLTENDKFHF